MKSITCFSIVLVAVGIAGCVSAPKASATFSVPGETADSPPRKNDYIGAYAYARGQMLAGEYPQARRYFELSVQWLPKGGTADGEFERENLVNAAWMALLTGDRSGAVALTERASAAETYAPPCPRLEALRAALLRDATSNLAPTVTAAAGL